MRGVRLQIPEVRRRVRLHDQALTQNYLGYVAALLNNLAYNLSSEMRL